MGRNTRIQTPRTRAMPTVVLDADGRIDTPATTARREHRRPEREPPTTGPVCYVPWTDVPLMTTDHMDSSGDLHAFLTGKLPFHDTETQWARGTMPLRVRYFVCDELPPERFITSVRCLVLRNDSVLVLTNRAGETHVLPGGQREAEETLEEAVRREVREESGWLIDTISILGFIHLQHLGPKPSGYRYPYPNFLQVVYCARATQITPNR